MSVVTSRHRTQYGESMGEASDPRHHLTHMKAGHGGRDRADVATDFPRRVRLGIPRLVLRRPTELVEKDAGLRSATATCRGGGSIRRRRRATGEKRGERQRERARPADSDSADAQPLAARQAVAELKSVVVD